MSLENSSPIFALDIGTRSVVGLLLQKNKTNYEIVDLEVIEHNERSMVDGQIHNVLSVSEVITEIKQILELRNGPLKKVCVAAAGRSLKTKRAKVDLDISLKTIFEPNDILHLELSAVQQAQYDLALEHEDDKSFNYYCVGYSVVEYLLDDEQIGSLLDQTGNKASVEVIATFLPKVVVESLIAALSRSELELEALTLEPIAAINVLIPPSMRRLNVALVDIGAGTSDIAITDEGTIKAYGMVPIAGDEITEAISDHFLLDFPDAEDVKRQLSTKDEVVLTDILGFETTYKREEVLDAINVTIEQLAAGITEEILLLNQQSPKAVMLVGGGSMTPDLAKHVARFLELPENRVAIRGIDAIKSLVHQDRIQAGPELVTPIGIAIAAKESPIEYISITVNDKPLRLFDIKKLTIGDSLLASGIELTKLYGKPGLAKMVTVNGRLISIPGMHGLPPTILKNGEVASLDTPISSNDQITVEKGVDGGQAKATVGDIIGEVPEINLTINGDSIRVLAAIHKNGKQTRVQDIVEERDEITVKVPETVHQVFAVLHRFDDIEALKPFYVYLNNKKVTFSKGTIQLTKNNVDATLSTPIIEGDNIKVNSNIIVKPTINDLVEKEKLHATMSISIFYNDEPLTLVKPLIQITRNEVPLLEKELLVNEEKLLLTYYEKSPFIFQDLFREVDIDLTPQPNKKLVIMKNGANASFSDDIQTGDKLEVKMIPIEPTQQSIL
ncbi:cell division FtsA domain-containing protein [Bacillus sp. FJAT-45350]|uniref:cell division FtsA domain-containing protein n=1 Tax=Bacillus sp. FJAT-45350 TaxID=2011014 RepID=UPI000BB82D56|nr:cell division FtsA domain-containing protein [Bacillus sp. FJAT-45350]